MQDLKSYAAELVQQQTERLLAAAAKPGAPLTAQSVLDDIEGSANELSSFRDFLTAGDVSDLSAVADKLRAVIDAVARQLAYDAEVKRTDESMCGHDI